MSREIGNDIAPPLHRSWDPDDSLDFHAARLLILILRCGEGNRHSIEGRTKLAKLDFFVRYPVFLERALSVFEPNAERRKIPPARDAEIEAPMIRYRYGPWDPRYRQFLAFLEARQLIRITRAKVERVSLTSAGRDFARKITDKPSFAPIMQRCDAMVGNLASLSGTQLKDLIYELFPTEVGDLPMRMEIRS
jgi:hypothetical protein